MSRVLWFHPRPLLPARGGGEVRTSGLAQLALDAGHEVLLVHAGPSGVRDVAKGLTVSPLEVNKGLSRLAKKAATGPIRCTPVTSNSLEEVAHTISEFSPHVAVVSELLSWSYARKLLGEVPFVYDAHNVEIDLLHSLRQVEMPMWRKILFRLDEGRTARSELSILSRARGVLAVSALEAERLQALSGRRDIVVVPSFTPTAAKTAVPRQALQRLLFVGTLNYPPNVEAIRELVGEIMPRVWGVAPDAELHVVGRQLGSEVRELAAGVDRVYLHVDVPDLTPMYQAARAAVIPMRSGAGSNLKVVEALSYGVPVVGTGRAFQGIDVRVGDEVLQDDDPDGLAGAVIRLLGDPELAQSLGSAGRSAFETRLAGKVIAAEALNCAIADAAAT